MSVDDTKTWRTGLRWFSDTGPHEYGFGVPTAHGEVIVTFRAKGGMSEDEARALQSMLESVPALHAQLSAKAQATNDALVTAGRLALKRMDLQARVKELEAESQELGREIGRLGQEKIAQRKRANAAESDRDALRAQVAALKGMVPVGLDLYWSKRAYAPVITAHGKHEYQAFEAVAAIVAAVSDLSAPAAETKPAANSPEIPDGSPSDDDFVTVRNTLDGSPGAASYNDAFNALLRLGLKAGKWDAALTRADDGKAQHQAAHDAWGSDQIGGAVNWVLHGDVAKETP